MVSVSGITIAFPDGSTKDMSIEHAKELHRQLGELFGSNAAALPSYYPVVKRGGVGKDGGNQGGLMSHRKLLNYRR